ncbi:MAG: FHA domain-containing protein [Dehalococcoidia bacterium]
MANPFTEGNVAWLWYQAWLPVITGIGALALLVYIFSYPVEGIKGTITKVIGGLAFLGILPLALERIGIGVDANVDATFYMGVLGFIAGIAVAYFHYTNRQTLAGETGSTSDEVPQEAAVSETNGDAGTDAGAVDDMGATMTQVINDPDVTPAAGTMVGDTAMAAPGIDPAQPQAFLLVKSGPQAGTSIPITQAVTMIGRSSESDIVLDDEQVSREHANITYADGQFTMVDSGSSSGTIVDGVAGETVVLTPGSEVKIGDTEIVFMQGQSTIVGSPAATAAATQAAAPTPAAGGGDPGATIVGAPEPELVMKWLAITDGPSKGTTVQLKSGRTTIGREQTNDIQITDATVSREHAAILSTDDGLKLVDLGSAAGTSVAGVAISGGKVGPGDVIAIGQNTMSLVSVDASVESTPQAAASSDATMIMEPETGGISAVLVVQSGPDAGKSFQLTEGDNVVGRDPGSDVLLTDESTSRRHAVLRKRDDAYAIYDLDSASGTRVNDVAVEGTSISAGQEIKFGNSTAVIMDPTASN